MLNFGWLVDGRLAGSGRVHPEEGTLLLEQGIRAVLSLTEADPAAEGPFPAPLRQIHLPVTDFSAPDPETLEGAMRFLEECLGSSLPVLVHCGGGYGRTGTILACWLVHEGATADEAVRRVRARRPGSIETLAQEHAVHAYAAERRKTTGDQA